MAKVRARYAVKGPRKEMVTFNRASMDKETKSLQQEEVTEERECFMVMFPQGHSIRVTSREQLKELGFDKKPRLVDMETGDVIDVGGDPYDFDNGAVDIDDNIVLVDDKGSKSTRTSKDKE